MLKGFITNLGKYNEGFLVGEWITFPIDEDELEEVFERIGINAQYEEYFFTDWECPFDTGLGEYESIESVNELAEDLGNEDEDLVEAIIEATGYSLRVALDHTDRAIFYRGQTLEGMAYEFVTDLCLPEVAQCYFDYEAYARDLRFDGYTEVSGGVILVD